MALPVLQRQRGYLGMNHEELVEKVAGHLHAGQRVEGARIVAEFSGGSSAQSDEQPLEYLNGLMQWCLNSERPDLAAYLLWGRSLFDPRPHATRLVWESFRTSASIFLLGAASMSKSYSMGVRLMLDWLRDPEWTTIRVVGPSEEHLKSNLFSHLVSLHQQASLPLPGIIGDLFIGLDRKSRKSSIAGVVIPLGKAGAGKLQGTKRVPRKKAHPVFGPLSRLRIFLDEIEKIPAGVWRDVDNLFANLDGLEGFKIIGACNPENINGPVAQRTEPVDGWDKGFDLESSEVWRSKRGWDVVRLDAFQCENVVQGRVIFPGLQTKEGLDRLIQNAGGVHSPSYYTFGRGAFPPQGTTFSIIPASSLQGVQGEFIFHSNPHKLAAVDVALEGTAAPKMAVGRFGLAVGIKHPADYANPQGREEIFASPRYGLQVDQLFSLPNAETVRMAANIKQQCQSLGVDPGWVLLDRTGNGAGVVDLLLTTWSPEVRGLNYSEAASDKKIFEEDSRTCKEEFQRADSELWFALQRWLEFQLIKLSPVVDTEKLFPQLTGRLYMPGKVRRVEPKKEYKARNGGESPDEADAITLLLHCARVASGVIPSMSAAGAAPYSQDNFDGPMPCLVGCTDKFDGL